MPHEGSVAPPPPAGFSAQVNGASMSDLVQMYCQTRTRAAIEVRSGLHMGYLFFDRGRLIHAEFGALTGEAAFAGILSLPAGAFQPSLRAWPEHETIECPVEGLLLRAAQAMDEERRRVRPESERTALNLPDSGVEPPPLDRGALEGGVRVSVTRPVGIPRPEDLGSSASAPFERETGGATRATQIASGVRLDPTGALVSQRGAKAEALAELVAFAAPLLNVIGEELGIGETRGVDFYCKGGSEVLLREEPDGSWVGAVGRSQELIELRKRIGAV